VLTFNNILLAVVGTLHCVCLQSITQHKLHICIYIYMMYIQYRVELETACPVLQQSKVVCVLMLYSPVVTICTA